MDPHPDFAETNLPRNLALGRYMLTPLSPAFVDEDLAAVLATEPLLDGIFGPYWPAGLTREENLIDLSWHEREFTARRSFSWILRDSGGTYIGCFYLYPAMGARGQAKAAMWLCDIPQRIETAHELKTALGHWMSEALPQGVDITWTSRPELE